MNQKFVAVVAVPLLAGAALSANSTIPDADKSASCSASSLRGSYGLAGDAVVAGVGADLLSVLNFDGAGKVAGKATAVVDAPAAVEYVEFREGTYTVNDDCTGTARFFAAHKTLSPIDHFHLTEFVISDAGRQLSMVLVTTEYRDGMPSLPTESATLVGRRI